MQFIKTAVADGVGTIAINNPPANVLSKAVFAEIGESLLGFQKDPAVRAVIITGEGANFAAGADIKEIAEVSDAKAGEEMSLEAHRLTRAIEESDLPVIAAVNGYCLGGGSELVLACHLRIANDKARIGQPECKVGIIPGMGGCVRLPRLVGRAKALELMLTGEPVSAQEAYRIGLVNAVVPEAELRRQATGLAKKIGQMSKTVVARILKAVRQGLDLPVAEAIKVEARLFGETMATADKKEGVTAFVEKRQPSFKDR